MPIFQQLCNEFCDAAGCARADLIGDDEGVTVFSTDMLDVAVNVMHIPESHPDSCFLLVDFGPPPDESQSAALKTLLLTNFTMLGEAHASAFSIHPVFGTITLQTTYPFAGADGARLLATVRALVAMALQWRRTRFLPDGTPIVDPEPGAPA